MEADKIHPKDGTAVEEKKVAPADDDIRRLGYDAKHHKDGSALNADRDTMYDDLTGVGESGSQGDTHGREDQNNIGPNGQP
ncbi:MAG: hypothetical protein V4671_31510 [Armatimonadota bacterium]